MTNLIQLVKPRNCELMSYVMKPSHPKYGAIHSILKTAGEPFRRLSMGETSSLWEAYQTQRSVKKNGLVRINPKVWELGQTGWISKSHCTPYKQETDPDHLLRAVYAHYCREVIAANNLKIIVPEKFLFRAPTTEEEKYFLVYKKIDLLSQTHFKTILRVNPSIMRQIAETIAKFVRCTGYLNIHQKNFCFTTSNELALVDTEKRHFSHSKVNDQNSSDLIDEIDILNLYYFYKHMSTKSDSDNIFREQPAAEVFARNAAELKETLPANVTETAIDVSSFIS